MATILQLTRSEASRQAFLEADGDFETYRILLVRYAPEDFSIPGVRIARMRRGKYVRIPPEWRGKVTYGQTKNKRQSRYPKKARRQAPTQEQRLMTIDEELWLVEESAIA